ncbi:hypothetical protein [cyanobacterium endosymbiont of Rhopalodia gibberula]|uniref:hypothetical protein n=1 Tax=cyanobacterium endosymbiont of Rhopalodia gibberula TaxID=1763363 RepID=UPI000E658B09|nr:hypothetical protein [cyanobacterium endosymbiont of Rhopalodia gibberula]
MGDNADLREVITTIIDNQVLNLNVSVTAENYNRLCSVLPIGIINPDGTTEVEGQIIYVVLLMD